MLCYVSHSVMFSSLSMGFSWDLPMAVRPASSVHGIFQARILEWVAISFSRGSSDTGIKPRPPALQADSLPFEPPGKADKYYTCDLCTVWNNGTTIISVQFMVGKGQDSREMFSKDRLKLCSEQSEGVYKANKGGIYNFKNQQGEKKIE